MAAHLDNPRGFTLVELLIVVAVIGVLATIGIPTFRRMIAKSRRGEATVALAQVFTAEATFYDEFGAYGNNLDALGIENAWGCGAVSIDDIHGASVAGCDANHGDSPVPASLSWYTVGFPSPTLGCLAVGSILPDATSPAGKLIALRISSYYTTFNQSSPNSVFGRQRGAGMCAVQGNPAGITTPVNVYSSAGGAYDRYTASATGVILPGKAEGLFNGQTATSLGMADVWTIDQDRQLINVQDGVNLP